MNLITLSQLPVITHKLKEAGQDVLNKISALELDKQIVTEDTIKALKSTRAELTKDFLNYEAQRKSIKDQVSKPYDDFNNIYKIEIQDRFATADKLLKDNIYFFEERLKKEKKELLIEYFNELMTCENIDFITFGSTAIEPNLSISEKKYKEQILAFVTKVSDDLRLIETQEYKSEIMVEYKKSLNVSASISGVIQRKELEKAEARRFVLERSQKRQMKLRNLNMIWDEMTRSYAFNDDLFIIQKDIEILSDDEFEIKFFEISEEVKKILNSNVIAAPVEVKEIKKEVPAPVSEKIVTASFEVSGTISQLKALSEYLKTNGLTYKNI